MMSLRLRERKQRDRFQHDLKKYESARVAEILAASQRSWWRKLLFWLKPMSPERALVLVRREPLPPNLDRQLKALRIIRRILAKAA